MFLQLHSATYSSLAETFLCELSDGDGYVIKDTLVV